MRAYAEAMNTPVPISPAAAMAWGLTSGAKRGPKPSLTLEEIIDAAIRVADEEGLEAVSMSRVAKSLGFTTMSLYRYVASKDELLMHMQDAALGPLPSAREPDGDWRTGLEAWTQAVLRQFRLHPWSVDIPMKGPPLMPRNVEWLDLCLGHLAGTPLSPLEKISTVLMLTGYAQTEVQREKALTQGRDGAEPSDAESVDYEEALRHVIDPQSLPALSALLEEGLFTPPPFAEVDDGDAFMLDFGLHRILDGLALLMSSRTAQQ